MDTWIKYAAGNETTVNYAQLHLINAYVHGGGCGGTARARQRKRDSRIETQKAVLVWPDYRE